MATKAAQASIIRRNASGLAAEFAALIRNLAQAMLDPYRPELHYMRGPGPKWHAKYHPAHAAHVPALARVRGRR